MTEVAKNLKRKAPFPMSTLVRLMRKNFKGKRIITTHTKQKFNYWLGELVGRITKEMDKYERKTIDASMFNEVIQPYEQLPEINKEREYIAKRLVAIQAECEAILKELDRKFRV